MQTKTYLFWIIFHFPNIISFINISRRSTFQHMTHMVFGHSCVASSGLFSCDLSSNFKESREAVCRRAPATPGLSNMKLQWKANSLWSEKRWFGGEVQSKKIIEGIQFARVYCPGKPGVMMVSENSQFSLYWPIYGIHGATNMYPGHCQGRHLAATKIPTLAW